MTNREQQTPGTKRPRLVHLALAVAVLGAAACDTDSFLEVEDPDVITQEVFQNPENLLNVRNGVLFEFARAYAGEENDEGGQILQSGLLADEFWHSGTFDTRRQIDQRDINAVNASVREAYFELQRARNLAELAAELFADSELAGQEPHAQVLNLAGFTYVFFGENYCPGVPFSRLPFTGAPTFGQPLETDAIFGRAVDRFNTALELARVRQLGTQINLALVGKARALQDLGRFGEAAATVQNIPTSFVFRVEYSAGAQDTRNAVWNLNNAEKRWSVASLEGTRNQGLRFFNRGAAPGGDPRVTADSTGFGFNGTTPHYNQRKYPTPDADIPLATGIEARLIEAEALLHPNVGDRARFFRILNDLRQRVPGLAPLADTGQSRRDLVLLLYQERAFWLWLTSHRLGDLRRLMKFYNFKQDEVFPTGLSINNEPYGDHVNLPVPVQEENNPNFTGCLSRTR